MPINPVSKTLSNSRIDVRPFKTNEKDHDVLKESIKTVAYSTAGSAVAGLGIGKFYPGARELFRGKELWKLVGKTAVFGGVMAAILCFTLCGIKALLPDIPKDKTNDSSKK